MGGTHVPNHFTSYLYKVRIERKSWFTRTHPFWRYSHRRHQDRILTRTSSLSVIHVRIGLSAFSRTMKIDLVLGKVMLPTSVFME